MDLKRVNGVEEEILVSIYKGNRTRNSISDDTGRHYNTVKSYLSDLAEEGMVEEKKVSLPDGGERWEYGLKDAEVKIPNWNTFKEAAPIPIFVVIGGFTPLILDSGLNPGVIGAGVAGGLALAHKIYNIVREGDFHAAYVKDSERSDSVEEEPVTDWKEEITG